MYKILWFYVYIVDKIFLSWVYFFLGNQLKECKKLYSYKKKNNISISFKKV